MGEWIGERGKERERVSFWEIEWIECRMKDWYIFKVINAVCGRKRDACHLFSVLQKRDLIFQLKSTCKHKETLLLNHKIVKGGYVFLTSALCVVLSPFDHPPRIHWLERYLILVENKKFRLSLSRNSIIHPLATHLTGWGITFHFILNKTIIRVGNIKSVHLHISIQLHQWYK
jgi:hypothetical protein